MSPLPLLDKQTYVRIVYSHCLVLTPPFPFPTYFEWAPSFSLPLMSAQHGDAIGVFVEEMGPKTPRFLHGALTPRKVK